MSTMSGRNITKASVYLMPLGEGGQQEINLL